MAESTTIGIRPLTEFDLDQVAAAERELFGSTAWTPGMLRDELRAPARYYVAAVAAGAPGRVLGYAGLWYDSHDCHVMTLAVLPEMQRRGIADMLLADLTLEALKRGGRRLLLEVRVDNDAALALYTKHGFERLGIRKKYYQPEGIDAYVLALDLKGPTP